MATAKPATSKDATGMVQMSSLLICARMIPTAVMKIAASESGRSTFQPNSISRS